jgi:ubiquinone/menaquinone biosynthesis C-methylase UbiE
LVSKIQISQKEYDDFSSLFVQAPALSLLHIADNCDIVNQLLEDIREKNDGTIINKHLQNLDCDSFRLKSREFEFIILSDLFENCSNKQKLLQSCYHALENGAFIIIIEQKTKNNIENILELLDQTQYRVPNPISIFEHHNVIMAKKLHMWGNGL